MIKGTRNGNPEESPNQKGSSFDKCSPVKKTTKGTKAGKVS